MVVPSASLMKGIEPHGVVGLVADQSWQGDRHQRQEGGVRCKTRHGGARRRTELHLALDAHVFERDAADRKGEASRLTTARDRKIEELAVGGGDGGVGWGGGAGG